MSLLENAEELRLIMEQAILPTVFDAVTEQITILLVMAMQDIVISLHESGQLAPEALADKLHKSAASCGQHEAPGVLLNVMADFCEALSAGVAPADAAQILRRSELQLVWSKPERKD